ncbi:MAG: alpha/beta hydrolase [Acidimicrobiia bacterium]|nr:alpha/beta hydrolase [Acidimicrobiia bacterium]
MSALLSEGSRVEILDDAGHFLQLEKPDDVGDLVVSFLT